MPDLRYERFPDSYFAVFTMDRPDRLNAQGAQMREELRLALAEFSHDPEMRVGIVTGAGRAFSAGADLREMAEGSGTLRANQTEEERIETYRGNQPFGRNPQPFIAAVNGLAIGAGMERAADCDIRIASTEAYFGLFEVKRGILANYAINHLARLMPFGEAMYLMLTGDTLSAEDAHRLGFVHEVLEPDALMPTGRRDRGDDRGQRAAGGAGNENGGPILAALRAGRILSPERRCGPPCPEFRGRRGRPEGLAEKRPPKWQGR